MLKESFKMLKNDPHYYTVSQDKLYEMKNEIDTLEKNLNALKTFYSTLLNMKSTKQQQ